MQELFTALGQNMAVQGATWRGIWGQITDTRVETAAATANLGAATGAVQNTANLQGQQRSATLAAASTLQGTVSAA